MGARENGGVHRNGNGRVRKVKRKGDGEWRSEGEKGRKGETILCAFGFYVGSSIVRRANAVHMVIVIVFIARLSPFTRFRISHIFQKEFSHLWIGRCVYSFFQMDSRVKYFFSFNL